MSMSSLVSCSRTFFSLALPPYCLANLDLTCEAIVVPDCRPGQQGEEPVQHREEFSLPPVLRTVLTIVL